MKMRYVRQEKKQKNNVRQLTVNTGNPTDYDFPQIEEYFLYNHKLTYPTASSSSATG